MHSVFRKRIVLISLAASLWMIGVFGCAWLWKRSELVTAFQSSYEAHLTTEFIQTTNDLYTLCRVADEAVRTRVEGALHVAARLLEQTGYEFRGSKDISWTADGLFGSKYPWILPVLVVGGQQIGPGVNQAKSALWVGEASDWVGAQVSLYERLSGTSDMLCVATSRSSSLGARKSRGRLTWRQPDGTLHPALSAVLRGVTYIGPLMIGAEHTFAGLQPLYDSDGQVRGALCVDFTQALLDPVLKIFSDINIGAHGYAWIIYGHDQNPGIYVVNPDRTDPAADWRDLRDDNGVAIYERMVDVATNLRQGEVAQNSWKWRDPGEAYSYKKHIFFTYFQPWDWVIGITAYEEDFSFMTPQNSATLRSARWTLLVAMGVALLVAVCTGYFFISKPVERCMELARLSKRAADGDLKGAQLGLMPERWADYKATENQTELSTLYESLYGLVQYCQRLKASLKSAMHNSQVIEQVAQQSLEQSRSAYEYVGSLDQTSQTQTASILSTEESLQSGLETISTLFAQVGKVQFSLQEALQQVTHARAGFIKDFDFLHKNSEVMVDQMHNVEPGASSLHKLSEQMHLLSFSTALEAFKAGAQGQPFQMIAQQMRQLAQHIQSSTDQLQAVFREIDLCSSSNQQSVQSLHDDMTVVSSSLDQLQVQSTQLAEVFQGVLGQLEPLKGDMAKNIMQIQQLGHSLKLVLRAWPRAQASVEAQSALIEQIRELRESLESINS